VSAERYAKIKNYLTPGLAVIETSPAAHDRQIAVSLALTHFIGRALAGMGAKQQASTRGLPRLLRILEVSKRHLAAVRRHESFQSACRNSSHGVHEGMEEIENKLVTAAGSGSVFRESTRTGAIIFGLL